MILCNDENGCGQLHFTFEPYTTLYVFYEKNNQGNQDIFTAIALFSKHGGKSGRSGKSAIYIFRKKVALCFLILKEKYFIFFYHFL